MEKSHKIALLSAGLLIGAQVGATVLTTETPDAALSEPLAAEAQAPDTATPAEVAEAGSTSTATPEATPDPVAVAEQPIIPRHIQYDTLPSPWEGQPMLPSLAAYLDQTEHLRVTGAPGSAFPSDGAHMLPSLAAYLDQRETTLIAQTQPPVVSEPAPSVALATTSPQEAGGPVTGSASNASPSF